MELNDDLVCIQGILSSVLKKTGDFTKICYTGGNESKILNIVSEIQKYFISKNYMYNINKVNHSFETQLNDIVLFLAINTSYRKSVNLNEFSHLTNIMPQFSRCLFVNTVFGLGLIKYFCNAIEKLPIDVSAELYDEMSLVLRKAKPKENLESSCLLLQTAVTKLVNLEHSNKYEDSVDNLIQVTHIILRDLTGICSDEVKNMKKNQIYTHMGETLYKLFDLLLLCDKEQDILTKFIDNVLDTTCCIVQYVTLNVFCYWVEVDTEDDNLQTVIANKAYLVLEKYQKYKNASPLISMLSTMARKPKSINEQVYEADIQKVISKVNQKDKDQKLWFQALFGGQVFRDKNAINCISKWYYLCDENDVLRLLNLYHNESQKNDEAKQLVIKCAANLSVESLILTITRHFHTNSCEKPINEDISAQLKTLFNRTSNENSDADILKKELTLLLLQNPHTTLEYMYSECLKNKFYTNYLKEVFKLFKEIAVIENIGLNRLSSVIERNKPDKVNTKYYVELFDVLLVTEHFMNDDLNKIVCSLLKKNKNEENVEDLRNSLQILLECRLQFSVESDSKEIIQLLLECMLTYRCTFLSFCTLKQEIVSLCVEIIVNKCSKNPSLKHAADSVSQNDPFINYYTKILNSETDNSLFSLILSDFDNNKLSESVTLMLKVLPSLVSYEWQLIFGELKRRIGWEKSIDVFTFSIILLCELVQARVENDSLQDSEINGLKFCLQNLGSILQKTSKAEEENIMAKSVCRLLRKLPSVLEDESFSLINIVPVDCLKRLAKDKDFVCLVALIKKPQICQVLAQKMLQ